MDLAGLAESVELGGFVPSTFYYLPLVQLYCNYQAGEKTRP